MAGHLLTVGSNIDPNDLSRGLKIDDDFTVAARFDLAMPAAGQGYGISLTDNTDQRPAAGPARRRHHQPEVRATSAATLVVRFVELRRRHRHASPSSAARVLAPLLARDQIVLQLTHSGRRRRGARLVRPARPRGRQRTSTSRGTGAHLRHRHAGLRRRRRGLDAGAAGRPRPGRRTASTPAQGTYGTLSVDADTARGPTRWTTRRRRAGARHGQRCTTASTCASPTSTASAPAGRTTHRRGNGRSGADRAVRLPRQPGQRYCRRHEPGNDTFVGGGGHRPAGRPAVARTRSTTTT